METAAPALNHGLIQNVLPAPVRRNFRIPNLPAPTLKPQPPLRFSSTLSDLSSPPGSPGRKPGAIINRQSNPWRGQTWLPSNVRAQESSRLPRLWPHSRGPRAGRRPRGLLSSRIPRATLTSLMPSNRALIASARRFILPRFILWPLHPSARSLIRSRSAILNRRRRTAHHPIRPQGPMGAMPTRRLFGASVRPAQRYGYRCRCASRLPNSGHSYGVTLAQSTRGSFVREPSPEERTARQQAHHRDPRTPGNSNKRSGNQPDRLCGTESTSRSKVGGAPVGIATVQRTSVSAR